MSCCACCCCFYPKYKQKVKKIYPRNPDQDLIKIEVEKLQYYCKQHPEKLSKVSEFLYQHLKWGLTGSYKNRNYVKNTVEAVDKILLVITPQNLNYYAVNYLKIIQKLLEQSGANASVNDGINNLSNTGSDYLEYQKLAASLFRKFCEKEASNQSTTNYNLNYDSFVGQFSSMCYNNNKDASVRAEVRSSGLSCLATMVKRLVPDDSLSAGFLWDNMDKIVPALLFIMHENYLQNNPGQAAGADTDENLEEDLESDHNLDRYLYGDFFIHSRTNNNLASAADNADTGVESDDVRIEFRKRSSIAFSHANSEKTEGNQANATNMSASNSDEAGTVFLVNRKNSLEVVDPDHEAKLLLKNLACKADYTTISKIVLPILTYLDANKPSAWEHSKFVRYVFLIIMYNVKQQHAIVIKELIKHLDSHINSSAKLKCHIIRAISTCIRIAAMHSVGTTGQIIEIFTYLLKHLKSSVDKASTLKQQLIGRRPIGGMSSHSLASIENQAQGTDEAGRINRDLVEENNLQSRIIDAMGQFTANLPDYSKNDVIMFIARQINSQQFSYIDLASQNQQVHPSQQNIKDQQNNQLRAKYFECLHEICTKYRPNQLFSAFTSVPFLEDILRLTLVSDWASRRKAHEILHLLLDKYQYLSKIKHLKPNLFQELQSTTSIVTITKNNKSKSTSSLSNHSLTKAASGTSLNKLSRNQTYLSQLGLNEPSNKLTSSREDIQFMRKNGRILLAHLNENLFLSNNRRENYESIFLTTCLFLIGLYNENEFLLDLIRFGFHVQELALLNNDQAVSDFSFNAQCSVHKFVCAFFLLLSKSSGISELYSYCSEVCDMRRKRTLYPYVYPEYILLNAENHADLASGSKSQERIGSLTEIETEFKRELRKSSQDYTKLVKRYEEDKLKGSQLRQSGVQGSEDALDQKTSKENLSKSVQDLTNTDNLAPWLFNKKTMVDILEQAGFSTTILNQPNSEYSLSVSYLAQTVASLQTSLKYRSPYSMSVNSFANLPSDLSLNSRSDTRNGIVHSMSGNIPNLSNIGNLGNNKNHNRGYSQGQGVMPSTGLGPSPSTHQLGSTPRRSIDAESSHGDDTSYDSASQYSNDQNDMEGNQKVFYIDPAADPQVTVNSAMYMKQFQDVSSFETIRRALLNGNGSNVASGGASLVNGNAASITSSLNNRSGSQYNNNRQHRRDNSGFVVDASALNGADNRCGDRNSNQSDQLEQSLKIISDFKQKSFDEQKQTLLRTNQAYMNSDKYQQVFEFISKELTADKSGANPSNISGNNNKDNLLSSSSQTNTGITTSQPTKAGLTNINNANNNLKDRSDSTSNISANIMTAENINSSLSVNSLTSNPSSNTNGPSAHSQMIPLNDIEFPKLFMY